jgi:hypothetical protein
MGSAISAPLLSGLLYSCETKTSTQDTKVTALVSDKHRAMMEEIAELIIPATDTPGAKEAKVPEYMMIMLSDCYPEADQQRFFKGLDDLDARAKKVHGNEFLDCKPEQQVTLLLEEEKLAKAERDKLTKARAQAATAAEREKAIDTPFFGMIKEMTLIGYFTSEPGATKALAYVHVPGRWSACEPVQAGQKAWAT